MEELLVEISRNLILGVDVIVAATLIFLWLYVPSVLRTPLGLMERIVRVFALYFEPFYVVLKKTTKIVVAFLERWVG